MIITFKYKNGLELSKNENEFLLIDSKKYGLVEINKYSSRRGVIDLVSIIETTLKLVIFTNFKAFFEGFIGEDWFKNLGVNVRQEIQSEINTTKNFLIAFYDVFIKNVENKEEAFVISERIDDVTLYVVINHYNMNEELLAKLPKTLVDTYGRISLGYINVESKICQLFPDFEKNEWRYLFAPTSKGFGDFIDQYFDFNLNKMIQIDSKSDFIERFNLNEKDKYKFIINPLLDR